MNERGNFMKTKFIQKLGAVCLGAALTSSSLNISGGSTPMLSAGAADSDNYAKLLQYSLYFYDANMCGSDVESVGALSWRGNCHTSDEVPGGFHDAGDHAMFGLPQGYTAMTLGWTYYEYKEDFDSLGLTAHFKKISKHFTEFFKKSVKKNGNNVSSILYQKGNGDQDHAYWGPPEKQGSREMFWSDGGAADIAADYASALAFDYLNFGDTESLSLAKALYSYSTNSNRIDTPAANGFYSNKSCKDEQCFAAGVLYLATKEQNYLNDLKSKQEQYQGWIHGWENVALGAACLLGEATGDWSGATGWMNQKANGGGYMFLDKWGSARLNCAFQTTAMIADKFGKGNYAEFCKGQMNYLLGQNPANTCFVCGFASNSAKNAHHRAASGYSGYGEFNGSEGAYAAYSPNGHVLVGALVGGPSDAGGSYQDNMNDYVCNEVACDYNAALVGAAAGLYHKYKTGSTVTSIEGVKQVELGGGGNSNPPATTPSQTTQSTQTTTSTTTTPGGGSSSSDDVVLVVGKDVQQQTEKGDDDGMNNYVEFSPQGAKSVTMYFTVKSNDTEASGAFGTWNGEWVQKDFTSVTVPSSKQVSVDYTVPSNVGATIKGMVFWPHGDSVVIDKVVLHMGSGGGNNTTGTTATTKDNGGSTGGNDVVLTVGKDVQQQTEMGDDDEMNNYVEFSPQGAKSVTMYFTVKSSDTEASGAFGTWNGEWVQKDFTGVTVPSSKQVSVDYTVPSNVGATIKGMVFWPHGNSVVIDKVVLHMDGSSGTTQTTKTTTTTTTTTTTKTTTSTTTTSTTKPVQASLLGDTNCDGKITVSDAILASRMASSDTTVDVKEQGKINADVNQDNTINAADVSKILRKVAGLE